MPYLKSKNSSENFMDVLLHDPQRYQPIVEFTDRVTQNLSQLSWSDCEYLATEISKVNGSGFCSGIHNGIGKALQQNTQLALNSEINALLVFAKKLNQESSAITHTDVEAVRQAGWNDQSIEDVVGLVACINIYNILANGLGYQGLPEEAFNEMGQATVQQQGYMPTFRFFVDHLGQPDSPT